MFLMVNGEPVEINDDAKMSDLLDVLEIPKTKVAVELNGVVIPNSELLDQALKDQDILEIVRAIGGG
tara:strand:+ start:80 stop:280 length:201 start_codon:yes stop_codon:yes gene_type:complete